MTRRLLLSYLGLALLMLLLLEIPLALLASRHERSLTSGQAEREATGLAAVASEDVEHGRTADLSALVARYQANTGGEVAVVDTAGRVLAASSGESAADVSGEERNLVRAALTGRSVSAFGDDEGQAWVDAAVPISANGESRGIVLLGFQAGATEDRIHDIWLALAGFGAAVLVVAGLVGMWLARSLSRPLARLESAVSELGGGDLAARAPDDDGPPQVRSLAGQFNHMAERLSELLDAQNRFVADASHQLRSPLTALRLRLENLEADTDPDATESIAAAGREVQRLSRVVDGLLTLGRASERDPDRAVVDIGEVIGERTEAWSALAEERGVELVPQLPPNGATTAVLVPGDLDQMLDNLLANAIDATPEGSTITVQLAPFGSGRLELHVRDQGPGMSPDDRRRAFERFWRGPATNGGNSGLGLAIVRQLASRNDASVELRQAQPTGLDAVIGLRAQTP